MGLTDDRDISETVSETWSTDVLGSDFDPNVDEDRLQEIAGRAMTSFDRNPLAASPTCTFYEMLYVENFPL